MATHLLNDYIVEVPADMGVFFGGHQFPGDVDFIIYRGIEISLVGGDDPEGTPYKGLYRILWEFRDSDTVLTLDDAKKLIDAEMVRNPLLDPKVLEKALPPVDQRNDYSDILDADFEDDDDLGFSAVM
jgi:hypothetical protein